MREKIVVLLVSLFVLASCNWKNNQPNHAFLESEDISLSVDNNVIIRFSPATWQLSYNEDNKEFRVHNDEMNQYFILSCNQIPTELNETVRCSLKWTTGEAVTSRDGLSFQVVRIEEDGRIWLWNKSKCIAVCVIVLNS